jgi:hypothetical protein
MIFTLIIYFYKVINQFSYNQIKEVLEEKEFSNKWLSDQIKFTVVTVNFWFSNKSQPSLKRFYEI